MRRWISRWNYVLRAGHRRQRAITYKPRIESNCTIVESDLSTTRVMIIHAQDCGGGGRRLQLSGLPLPRQGQAWHGAYDKGDALDLALRRTTEAC
jgi:hypothetical protein